MTTFLGDGPILKLDASRFPGQSWPLQRRHVHVKEGLYETSQSAKTKEEW
jgi:hypothetical protein